MQYGAGWLADWRGVRFAALAWTAGTAAAAGALMGFIVATALALGCVLAWSPKAR